MNHVEQHIEIRGEKLVLSNYRAVFWPKKKALIISDVHIGKTAHFRKHGIQISSCVQKQDLNRLSFLITQYNPKTLIIVGDLFHAGENSDLKAFSDWCHSRPNLKLILVKGNHDKLKLSMFKDLNIELYNSSLVMPPFQFVHEPTVTDLFSVSGHLHPGYLLKVKGRQRLKLPCFQMSKSQLILPAFSTFTGLAISENQNDYKYYAFTEYAFYEFN